MIDEFIAMTRRIIVKDGFQDYSPTLLLPSRKDDRVLEGVPDDEDLEMVVEGWAARIAGPEEDYLAAFKFDDARFDLTNGCIYTPPMRFTWDERKRRVNLKAHGIDFLDAPRVFEGPTFTFEDDRFAYGEQRFVTLGFLGGVAVSIVHTETPERIHVISLRRATRNEETILFKSL